MPRQSATPLSLTKRQSDRPSPSDHLHTILPRPSDHLPPSHRLYDAPISPSACPSLAVCLTSTMTHPPKRPSSHTIHRTQDSIHSLAVVNGEQSHTIHHTQDSSQSLAVMNGSNPARPRNSIGPFLTMTYFYVPLMPLASTYVT